SPPRRRFAGLLTCRLVESAVCMNTSRHRLLHVERRHQRNARELYAAAGAALALRDGDLPARRIRKPQAQQMALARSLRPVLVFPPCVQHDEIVEELDVARLEV